MILTTMADYQRNLTRTREFFENFANAPLGCHGKRRLNSLRDALRRLVLVEKAMLRDAMPIKRFETLSIQIEYTKAMTACGLTDEEVTSKKRPNRAVSFRWAWFMVGRDRGISYLTLARTMGRNSHSWTVEIPGKVRTGTGRNARLAREFVNVIRKALNEKRCSTSDNLGAGRPPGGSPGQRAGWPNDPRPVPDLGQRGVPVPSRGAEETGDLVPGGVAMVRG